MILMSFSSLDYEKCTFFVKKPKALGLSDKLVIIQGLSWTSDEKGQENHDRARSNPLAFGNWEAWVDD